MIELISSRASPEYFYPDQRSARLPWLPVTASGLKAQQRCTTGHAHGLPCLHHGLAHGCTVFLAAKGQNAGAGTADGASPGSGSQGGFLDLLSTLDQSPAVGLMQSVVHPVGDQVSVAGA